MSAADPLADFTQRLQGVRRTGPGKIIARCPGHDDRRPSLSVRQAADGRLLLRCWAGCDAYSIVAALGLDLSDLFPRREAADPGSGPPRERRPWLAADLLHLAAFEASVAALVSCDLIAGRQADVARLLEAARRLGDMVEAVHGRD